VCAVGLAKRNEEIFRPDIPDPLVLPRSSNALQLLQRVRDEAHRFAIAYHRNVRGKTMRMSVLNDIPGVGPKRRKALVRHFGTLDKIKNATPEELTAAPTMSKPAAEAVHKFFRSQQQAAKPEVHG